MMGSSGSWTSWLVQWIGNLFVYLICGFLVSLAIMISCWSRLIVREDVVYFSGLLAVLGMLIFAFVYLGPSLDLEGDAISKSKSG